MKQFNAQPRKGYVLLLSVLIVGVVATSVVYIATLIGIDANMSSLVLEESALVSSYTDACAEEALRQIYNDETFAGPGSLFFGACNYTIVDGGGENRTINVTGNVNDVYDITKKVKIQIDQINPNINIISWQEVAAF